MLKLGHLNDDAVGEAVGALVGCDGRLDTYAVVGSVDGIVVDDGLVALVTNIAVKLAKLILPNPVTGSQPADEVKPELQQVVLPLPPLTQHLLFPEVMSRNLFAFAYIVGLMKPTVPNPFTCRCELIKVTTNK